MRRPYAWPRLTVATETGARQIDVHCARDPRTGAMSLVAFSGVPAAEQLRLVRTVATELGNTVVDLDEDDISREMGERLAAHFDAHPETHVGVVQVQRAPS